VGAGLTMPASRSADDKPSAKSYIERMAQMNVSLPDQLKG